jgi:hypothetical protein
MTPAMNRRRFLLLFDEMEDMFAAGGLAVVHGLLLWWIFDNHTVEARHRRIKPSTERRPHHHRNLTL